LTLCSLKQLIRESDRLWVNPIFDLLAQAAADNAFGDYSTIDQVLALEANPKELRRIRWKDNVLRGYVLKNSEGGPIQFCSYNNILRDYIQDSPFRPEQRQTNPTNLYRYHQPLTFLGYMHWNWWDAFIQQIEMIQVPGDAVS
jgi:hypothetical protein